MRLGKSLLVVFVLALVTIGASACGDDDSSAGTTADTAVEAASTVNVELGEDGERYFVKIDKNTVAAGETTFVINNVGEEYHEFIVWKTDTAADQLPLNDEKKVEIDEEGAEVFAEAAYANPPRGDEDHHIRPGRGVNLTMNLTPGKYVLLCNLAGHYAKGQWVEFTVEGEPTADAGAPPEEESVPAPPAEVVGTPVNVQLGEDGQRYFVKIDKNTVAAGETTFVIDNVGEEYHEFIVWKTDTAADKLPLNDENKVEIDEEGAEFFAEAAYTNPPRGDEDHHIRSGRGVNLTVNLTPGKYVLLCNIAGHYAKGQWVEFTVT